MSVPIVQIRDYHSECDGGMTNRDRWAHMDRARWRRGFTSCRSEGQHPGSGKGFLSTAQKIVDLRYASTLKSCDRLKHLT